MSMLYLAHLHYEF